MSTLLFILIASNANIVRVLSAPISSRDANEETVHWVSGPNNRGTFELTLSCVLTLLLCVWTSLHLNIPPEGESKLQQFWGKFVWTFMALFAPEVVVLVVWKQQFAAKALSREMNKLIDKKAGGDRPRIRWTITHSFFAGMGGFTVEFDTGETRFIKPKNRKTRIPLTTDGVLLLAKCGYILDISEGEIIDKSKADGLAKMLVCVQAGWCLLQYIGRLAAGLPVSLLELNTLGHALCALTIYIPWWRKPLDIKEPHVLSGNLNPPLFAYIWMKSVMSQSGFRSELEDLSWDAAVEGRERELAMEGVGDPPTITLSPGDYLFGHYLDPDGRVFRDRLRKTIIWKWPFLFRIETRREPGAIQSIELSAVDIRRWRLASDAIRQHPELREMPRQGDPLCGHASNWYTYTDSLISKYSVNAEWALPLISMAYGALHASGWNHFFSSRLEQFLWRLSSAMIMAPGILPPLYAFFCWLSGRWLPHQHLDWLRDWFLDWLRDWPTPQRGHLVLKVIQAVLGVVVMLGLSFVYLLTGYAYYVTRGFLVVEAFISLRELPADVYITPSWSQSLPHL